jgi:hypothetical protein
MKTHASALFLLRYMFHITQTHPEGFIFLSIKLFDAILVGFFALTCVIDLQLAKPSMRRPGFLFFGSFYVS